MHCTSGVILPALVAVWFLPECRVNAYTPFRKDYATKLTAVATEHEKTVSSEPSRSPTEGNTRNRPERGKYLPEAANEQDLYEAYAEIQSDYQSKAFASKDWTILNVKQNVTVSILHHPDDPTCPYVKMQGVIPVPVDSCWNFLRVDHWDRNMPKMDPFYEGVHIHGEYLVSVSNRGPIDSTIPTTGTYTALSTTPSTDKQLRTVRMILCRKRMRRLLTFGKRDLVFLSVTEDEPLADGTRVSGTVSVRTRRIPRVPGYTRAFQDSIAFYQPVANGTATDLTIVCRIDLNDSGADGDGGLVPMWIYVKTIGRTAVASIQSMRQALLSDQENMSSQHL